MIRETVNKAKPDGRSHSSAPGRVFRSRHRGDDATERLERLTEALRQYGYDIPKNMLAGPEDICWID